MTQLRQRMSLIDTYKTDWWEILKMIDELSLQGLRSDEEQPDSIVLDHFDDFMFLIPS